MKIRLWIAGLGLVCGCFSGAVLAQANQAGDYIVAVVNSEPITNGELRTAILRAKRDMAQQRIAEPSDSELRKLMLERLISERAQLQFARESGIRIEDAAVDQSEIAVARQNQVDVPEMRQRLAREGVSVTEFRKQLRDQLTLTRLHERDVEGRLRVSEADIDRVLAEQKAANSDPMAQEINLANLLIAVPESANAEQRAEKFALAQKVLLRARAGEEFATLVQQVSNGDKANDGQLGLRRADRYPPSFVDATRKLAVGEVSDVVRSGAGYHILKVVERRAAAASAQYAVQSHVQHILLRPGPQLTQAAAIAKLTEFKKRIESGGAKFQALAREFSQDGSAAQGGDLGWVGQGAFVPEFEEPMNRLAEGQISAPVVSRFGVHLIQMLERRRVELTERERREAIRAQIRESRYEGVFTAWAQELRANAFVEIREPAQ